MNTLRVPQQCGIEYQDDTREVREATREMEGYGPPRSACRGRSQTTFEWHWLKTVVASVEGKVMFEHCM